MLQSDPTLRSDSWFRILIRFFDLNSDLALAYSADSDPLELVRSTFYRGKTKIHISTEERISTTNDTTPLYVEGVHMIDGLADDKIDRYLDDYPKIIPLFEVNIIQAVIPYVLRTYSEAADTLREMDLKSVDELGLFREAWEHELAISQHVKASTLKEIDLGRIEEPRPIKITKELMPIEKSAMVALLTEYKDIFAWSYNDMQGLNPQYYEHHIHLNQDTKPVQQR